MLIVKGGLLVISLCILAFTTYLFLYKNKINIKKENDEQIKIADFFFLIAFSILAGYISLFANENIFYQLLPTPFVILFCHFLYRVSNKKDDTIYVKGE